MDNSDSDSSSTSGENVKVSMKIPKFNGENFSIWERKVQMYLQELDLLEFIELPLRPDVGRKTKKKAFRTANILCNNLTDEVFNTVVTNPLGTCGDTGKNHVRFMPNGLLRTAAAHGWPGLAALPSMHSDASLRCSHVRRFLGETPRETRRPGSGLPSFPCVGLGGEGLKG
ncbi:uncharacterized protein PGTG_16831 [Puccinia graminis f. sp. tritici CRL 75-36-700-3]|uniref:DUF4219 domain-containing protein n=1 Tax=Puccinia graminis f. sp. tritici (strain CRL 75-36-700-3 / race SCCL) TaxID=418459 RepID=E3L2Q4_PUCGT|nr:uncharacterized protein PGTG_16831 [Puccinia graminis f. sp. tritici CRL 75-36-700-3]EFP90805.2 hypothetical protein PGTG_16831 [Puccinia graminis f. sp. tritici CRL 75-36-700-3]